MSGNPVTTLRRLWLDARCGAVMSPQRTATMREFLDCLLASVDSRRHPDFKLLFGNGDDLVLHICREFVANTQEILRGDPSNALRLVGSAYRITLIAALSFLIECSNFRDADMALLASTYEQYANYNVVALALLAHHKVMELPPLLDTNPEETEAALQNDISHLALVLKILRCPMGSMARRCISEALIETSVLDVAGTLRTTLSAAWQSSADMSETAIQLFKRQIFLKASPDTVRKAHMLLEGALATPINKASAFQGQALAGLVCALEGVVASEAYIGFPFPETLSFASLTAGLLTVDEVVGAFPDLGERLVACLHTMAVAPRKASLPPPLSGSSLVAAPGALGLLKLVPGSLIKMQRKLSVTFGGDAGATRTATAIGCGEVVECLSTLFVCASTEQSRQLYGDELFKLLSIKGIDETLVHFCLNSCLESLADLSTQQLTQVFRFIHETSFTAVTKTFIEGVVRALATGAVRTYKRRGAVVDFFIAFSGRDSTSAAVILAEGSLDACVRALTLPGSTKDDTIFITEDPDESVTPESYAEKVSIFSKVLVRSPEAAPFLASDGTPARLLNVALDAEARGLVRLSAVVLDVFIHCVVRTGEFYPVLLSCIVDHTGSGVWERDTSLLLAALALTLRRGTHAHVAAAHNAVELCLALTHEVDYSQSADADLFCLGVCLRCLLLVVRQSDVWTLFDSSIGTMAASPRNVQFVANLCCGYYGLPECFEACARYARLRDPELLLGQRRQSDNTLSFGVYRIPAHPLCDFVHPHGLLLRWASQCCESNARADAQDVVATAEALVLRSEVVLPNAVIVPYILRWDRVELLCCVEDIADVALRPLLFCDEEESGDALLMSVRRRQDAWVAALSLSGHRSASPEKRQRLRFGANGGVSGTVKCADAQWPPAEGFSVALWVYWRPSPDVVLSDGKHGPTRGVVWLLQWQNPDDQRECAASYTVNPADEYCTFSFSEGSGRPTAIELPFIPSYTWVHAVVCLHRRSHEVTAYYNGNLVTVSECTYPRTGGGPAAALLGSSSTLQCSVGSPVREPNVYVVTEFVSFDLYMYPLGEDEAAALYCTVHSDSAAHAATEVSLRAPFIESEAIRSLSVCHTNGTLAAVCAAGVLPICRLPLTLPLISLRARSMVLTDDGCGRFGNKTWALWNCAPPHGHFALHGTYREPGRGSASVIDSLVAHGAMREWLHWMDCIDRASAAGGDSSDTTVNTTKAVHQLLRILFTSTAQVALTPVVMRRFVVHLTDHIIAHPHTYLSDEELARGVAALSVRCPTTGDAPRDCFRNAAVSFTFPLEHIFFNWKILLGLPPEQLRTLLTILEELLSPENPYRVFNATRLRAADFVNGFVLGLLREFVGLTPVLQQAMHVIFLVIQSLRGGARILDDILMACALTIPTPDTSSAGHHLGSKLLSTSMSYVVTVRNMLLKAVNDLWDSSLEGDRVEIAQAIGGAAPKCWFAVLTSAASHPVSTTLALRLWVIAFLFDRNFRGRYKDEGSLFLRDSLRSFAQEADVLDLFFHAFLGHVAPVQAPRVSFASLEPRYTSSPECLLVLALLVIKYRSQMMLQAGKVMPRSVRSAEYFSELEGRLRLGRLRPSRTLRCVVHAIVFCRRVRKMACGRCEDEMHQQPAEEFSEPVLAESALGDVMDMNEYCSSTREGICEGLEWLAIHYRTDSVVREALYCSSRIVNPVDLLGWPLHYTLHSKGSTSGDAPSPDSDSEAATSLHRQTPMDADLDDDDEWEVLPAVVEAKSRSSGLDGVATQEGLEGLYDACRSLYLVHAAYQSLEADMVALSHGRVKVRKFVEALHRSLCAIPQGVGSDAEDTRAAFLCTVWMKAAEQSIDSFAGNAETPALKNALALAKYMLDRLVSGSPVPPLAMAGYYKFLLVRLGESRDVAKLVRTCLFEWMMYLMSPAFHCFNGPRAGGAIEMIHTCDDALLAVPMPSEALLRAVLSGLVEVSHVFVCSAETEGTSSSRKLGAIWELLVTTNKHSPAFAAIIGPQSPLRAGIELLMPPTSSRERFAAWLRFHKDSLLSSITGGSARYEFTQAEGGKYLKIQKTGTHSFQKKLRTLRLAVSEAQEENELHWQRVTDTATCVDAAVLVQRRDRFIGDCVLWQPTPFLTPPHRGTESRSWSLLQSGAVGLRSSGGCEGMNDPQCEPVHNYIHYVPPMCLPLQSVHEIGGSPSGHPSSLLRPNAAALLRRISGHQRGDCVQWIGNIYYVVGAGCHISTLVVTGSEVLIVSCSQVSRSGDFFIAQIRPHAATQHSLLKNSLVPQALRRFLPSHGTRATNSQAAFRYSQYYRQLRSESTRGAPALVWRFPLGGISALHERLFQHLPTAAEFVLETGERFLVVVLDDELSFSKGTRDRLIGAVAVLAPRVTVDSMSTKKSRLSAMTRRWVQRSVSTAAYLAAVNDAASRTVADIGQYPIMPWVLRDYTSAALDVSSPAVYRPLGTPIGALNAAKAQQLAKRYAEWLGDSANPPFHHGTHYSSAAIVLYYLLRLEPFTASSITFQGGHLDIADRLFHSVSEAWENGCGSGMGDVKELIPEFYELPDFLMNMNNTQLGARHDGVLLGDVILPPWAHGQPFFFVHMLRMALEGETVSETLCGWLDLIFGCKQKGEEAAKVVNVFHHLSYQEGVDRAISHAASEEDRKAIVASADSFGQTPLQLFGRHPHPRRAPRSAASIMQDYLISNVRYVKTSSGSLCTNLGAPGCPVSDLQYVSGTFYGTSPTRSVSWQRPVFHFIHDAHTDTLGCFSVKDGSHVASLPSIQAFGCGPLTAIASTANGTLVCAGTRSGTVIAFGNTDDSHHYCVTAVMHPHDGHCSAVHSLTFFESGRLIVTHTAGSLVCGWHVSQLLSTYCFSMSASTTGDNSPVSQVAKDTQSRLYYGAKERTIFIFTGGGVLISTIAMAPLCTPITLPTPGDQDYRITAIAMCTCQSYSRQNLLVLGHASGAITFWVVEDTTQSQNYINPHTIRLLHNVLLDSAITSIRPAVDQYTIGVGLANGTLHILGFPRPDAEDI